MYSVDHDAVFLRFLLCEYEMIARSEQRLARNAADIETSAAEFFVFLNDRRFQSQLRRTNRRHVPARPRSDDNNIVVAVFV